MLEIYLDNSATTKPLQASIDACVDAMKIEYGNPSSLHKKGFLAEQLIKEARNEISRALFCEETEIYFTSGATESNNLAIIGGSLAMKRKGNRIITSAVEHPSVKEAMAYLETQGYEIVTVMPNEHGEYTAELFANAVDEKTILVSCMFVNNETGLILPVLEIAKAVKRKNSQTLVHVDAVQGFLKLPLKLKNSGIDLLSISGHKIFAPKGVGALYIKKGVRTMPLFYGGGQQNGVRPGTENVPLISAFGKAVQLQRNNIVEMMEHYQVLKQYLLKKLADVSDVAINSKDLAAPHIVNFSVKNIRSEVMLHFLEQYEIYISSGSACAKGKQSYVLSALGISKENADTALRISFGKDTTEEMLDIFVDKLKEGIASLAKIKR